MATQEEVAAFLRDFKVKMDVLNILFRDERMKNSQAMLSMEMSREKRETVIKNLAVADYCEGPLDDNLYGTTSIWVFGKWLREPGICIRISIGKPNGKVLFVSFQPTEHGLLYPFKKR
jgi:hypothetical protein